MGNAEWLQFLSDLDDLACVLRSEALDMPCNAELVDKAKSMLIDWNPNRNSRLKT